MSENERSRINAYFSLITRGYQVLHHQAGKNMFDLDFWENTQNHFADLMASKAYRQYWAIRRHRFNPAFQTFVDDLIANRSKAQLVGLADASVDSMTDQTWTGARNIAPAAAARASRHGRFWPRRPKRPRTRSHEPTRA